MKSRVIMLTEADNVVVTIAAVGVGDMVEIDGVSVRVSADVGIGHKLARRDLGAGERIVKLGAPIGILLSPVRAGDHIHDHNLASAYMPSAVSRPGKGT